MSWVPAKAVYQPIYVKGQIAQEYRYQRDCESRYWPIRDLAAKFNRPFSVLDIGANYGYFDMRLMEEFDCTCVMIDNKDVVPIIEANGHQDRSVTIFGHPSAQVYHALSQCEHFDIVLALAVLHHFDDPVLGAGAIMNLGSYSFFEIPGPNDTLAANPSKHATIAKLFEDEEPVTWFDSHVSDTKRPLYMMENTPVLVQQTIDAADRGAPCYSEWSIDTDFDHCTIKIDRAGKVEERDFIPGMNVYNWNRLGGRFPKIDYVENEMHKYESEHPDFQPWNFIIGNGVHPIDMVPK